MKKIFWLIIFLMIIPSKVYGICSSEEKVRLTNLAKNLDITSEYYRDEKGKVKFKMTITNLHPDIYIYDKEHFDNIYFDGFSLNPKEVTIDEYPTGASYSFTVYGNTPKCQHEFIMTQYKTVPAYNAYSEDPLCKGIEEYELCQRWKSAPVSYENFKKSAIEYRESLNKEIVEVEEIEKDFDYYVKLVVSFLLRYYIYYILAIVLVAVLIILLRKNDTFKLE